MMTEKEEEEGKEEEKKTCILQTKECRLEDNSLRLVYVLQTPRGEQLGSMTIDVDLESIYTVSGSSSLLSPHRPLTISFERSQVDFALYQGDFRP